MVAPGFLLLASIFQCANGKGQFDAYTFTVNVDDIEQIAKYKNISIESSVGADFQVNEDRNLRIIGFVGHMNAGKTWLIDTMFGKKLRTKELRVREEDEHGLNVLYIPDGSWLIVDMLGSIRQSKSDPEKNCSLLNRHVPFCRAVDMLGSIRQAKKLILGQHFVETLRYMMMVQLCHAIVYVTDDYGKMYGPFGDPLARLSSMLTQASELSQDAPIMMVAHNFRSVGTIEDMKTNLSHARVEVKSSLEHFLGAEHVSTSNVDANDLSFQATVRTKGADTVFANFGFAQDGSDAGKQFNHKMGQVILNELRDKLPVPKRINMARELEASIKSSLHYFVDGKKDKEDKLASFTRSNLTCEFKEVSGRLSLISIKGLAHMESKKDFVEAETMQVHGPLINDVKYLPNHNFKELSNTVTVDKENGRRIKTLQLAMAGVRANDTELMEKNGKIYLKVNVRSRRPNNEVVHPASNPSNCRKILKRDCTATFSSGPTQMRLPFDGWSFNILDPKARLLRDGIYTLIATQEL